MHGLRQAESMAPPQCHHYDHPGNVRLGRLHYLDVLASMWYNEPHTNTYTRSRVGCPSR
jgi:hypothetical protein